MNILSISRKEVEIANNQQRPEILDFNRFFGKLLNLSSKASPYRDALEYHSIIQERSTNINPLGSTCITISVST